MKSEDKNRVREELRAEGMDTDAMREAMRSTVEYIKNRLVAGEDTNRVDVANHIASLAVNEKEKIVVAMFAQETISKFSRIGRIFDEIMGD